MASEKLRKAMNEQIGHELYSSHLYLAMSVYCADRNLKGFAHWMRQQSREEAGHAMRFVDFLLECGERVELAAIDQPPADFGSPLDIMQGSLDHERKVTGLIERLYETAGEEKDYPAQVFLQWFISEQVEEESRISEIVEQLKLFGSEGIALLTLDRELGSRTAGEGEE
ncbi:MAG: ferritin [Gemmatimonadota bacterium]